jgi:hypothetical protein
VKDLQDLCESPGEESWTKIGAPSKNGKESHDSLGELYTFTSTVPLDINAAVYASG